MMSREFTRREKILLLVLCLLLLIVLYYQFLIKDVDETIEKYDTTDLETELLIEQAKAMQIKQMDAELKKASPGTLTLVASYNNMKNEITALNDIFSAADTYNIEFVQPVREGDSVRRDIHIVFTAGSYDRAEEIIKKIHDCKYRCLVKDVRVIKGSGTGIGTGTVSASVTATFFETMYGADTTVGLEVKEDEGKKTSEE